MCNVINITTKKKVDYEPIVNFLLSYLNIEGIELLIYNDDKLLDKFETDNIELNALLYERPIKGIYALCIKEHSSISSELILCHEMVHLKQYYLNELILDLDKKEFTWKGKTYKDVSYYNRPWEKEAFKMQTSLLREWKKYKKLKKKEAKNK